MSYTLTLVVEDANSKNFVNVFAKSLGDSEAAAMQGIRLVLDSVGVGKLRLFRHMPTGAEKSEHGFEAGVRFAYSKDDTASGATEDKIRATETDEVTGFGSVE